MPQLRTATLALILVLYVFCGSGFNGRCGASEGPAPGVEKPSVTDLFSHKLLLQDRSNLSEPATGLNGMKLGQTSGLKSPVKAVMLSLLLPGAGQSYLGATTKSRIFYSVEAVAWLAYGGFKTWENHKINEYEGWAAEHAGIDPAGKPSYFWQMMTYYDSRLDYEIYGRAGQPDRPSYPDLVGWDWEWDSEAARSEYRQIRNGAKGADRKATFSLVALALNRIVAAIDAYRDTKSYNRRRALGAATTKMRIKGKPFGENPNVMLVFQRVF